MSGSMAGEGPADAHGDQSSVAGPEFRDASASLGVNPESIKIPHYPLFDWLRFVLASIVVLDHHGFVLARPINGGFAVDVFFALSGWLIGGILLRTEPSELPRFYFNRATRIWIPYALAILLLYGFAAVREGMSFFWLKYLVLDTTFTHFPFTVFPRALSELPLQGSGNHFWSISVEEQFYLIAPLFIVMVNFGRSTMFWLAAAAFAIIASLPAAPIALGVAAAIARRDFGWQISGAVWWAILLTAVGAFAALYVFPGPPLNAGLALLIVLLTSREGIRREAAVVFGGLSYPLYLNHWLGIFAVHFVAKRYVALPEGIVIAASYALNVGVALVLYGLVDRQIQKRRNGWFSPKLGRVLAIAAYTLLCIGLVSGWAMNRYGPLGQAHSVGAAPGSGQP